MIAETSNAAPSFTAQCWITGASGFTDSDPNSVPPAASRIIRFPAYMPQAPNPPISATLWLGAQLMAVLADGTSATIRFWWYDDVEELWVPSGATVALTYATGNQSAQTIRFIAAKWFCQVTANTGVTKIAFFIR